jgi:tetratricopeptide (TPR) repeat protein
MKQILVVVSGLIALLSAGSLLFAQADKDTDLAQIVAQSQEALDAGDDTKALTIVKAGLERFPGSEELRVQMAAIYADQNQDQAAIDLLRALIRDNPSSRAGKLKLAQIHGYRAEYSESDRLYRELLSANPGDETASLGLAHNLILEGKKAEAQLEVRQAVRLHPASLLLQEYNDSLRKRRCGPLRKMGPRAGRGINLRRQFGKPRRRFFSKHLLSVHSQPVQPLSRQ